MLTLNNSITWRLDNLCSQIWHRVAPFSHKAILCLDSRSTLFSVSLVNGTRAPGPNFLVFLRRANGDPLWYFTIAINCKELRVTLSSINNQHKAVYGRSYFYMTNFCNLIGLEQWYFSLIWSTYMKYHSWYLCQISLQIMLLPILIASGSLRKATLSVTC